MSRSRRQIDEDARMVTEAVHAAGRPLRLDEIADALRRRGRAQTDKQARVTAGRALELGILRRKGSSLWDLATPAAVDRGGPPSAPPATASASDLIYCARRMLELPASARVNRVARQILDEATRRLPSGADAPGHPGPVTALEPSFGDQGHASQGNGAARAAPDDNPEIEVLLSSVAR